MDVTVVRDATRRIIRVVVATPTGATADRPSAADTGAGATFFDTTLGKPVWSDGTDWVDATGTAV